MKFDGATYEPTHDYDRLESQLNRVKNLMLDGEWRTLQEIHSYIGGSEAGISARLRDLRKSKFGGFIVNRRPYGDRSYGLFEYQLVQPSTSFQYDETGQGVFA